MRRMGGLPQSRKSDPDVAAVMEEQLMKAIRCVSALLGMLPLVGSAAEPWREVTTPTVAEAAATFAQPPMEYRAVHWAIWGGQQTKERIIADIDRIAASGGGVYMINNSQRVAPKYLSPEYMDLVKTVVQQCKKNGMKVWIETDCGYPDGFAGGMISEKYPQLGMQGIIADARCTVAAGATLDIPLPVDTLGITASPRAEAAAPGSAPSGTQMPLPADGVFKYSVPRGGAGELTVQLPGADIRYSLSVGEPFSILVPPGTKGIYLNQGGGARGGGRGGRGGGGTPPTVIPLPADGHLKWTAPAGASAWEVTFIRHVYRSSPTRNDNGIDGGATKDSLYTLIDYLDPEATKVFIQLIHETYEKAVGDEFGKTILGFRGDEPDYSGLIPWTPKLLETFQQQKGYDLKPYIPLFFAGAQTPEAQRARADYYDVWSGMFRDSFFKLQQEWCNARNMQYMVHLNHEESMMQLVNSEGSFWRDMRYVGVPGIDNLGQISPTAPLDFPKLAGSAAHLFGRPLVWTEQGDRGGKFVADHQLVRGVNHMNISGMGGPRGGGGGGRRGAAAPSTQADARGAGEAPARDGAAGAQRGNGAPSTQATPSLGWYVSRSQHLLAIGRPAAQVALYHPTDSMWLGDRESDSATLSLVTQLMEHQIDFDHIDADTLTSVCTLEGGGLKNLSGQVYKAIVIPSCTVIQKSMLDRLRAFASAGGKVIFVGRTPTMLIDKTFMNPEAGAPDLSFATIEPTPQITDKVVAALPKPDVKLDSACAPIKYNHRSLKDGELYFFFNESDQPQTRTATLAGTGQVQVWDATSGTMQALAGATASAVPLKLEPYEAKFIVIGPLPAGVR
jgi:hypothetical protein